MRRHRFDPFSFLFGALFVTLGATFVFGDSGARAVRPWRLWPAAVVVVGLTVVLWTVVRVLRPQSDAAMGAVPGTSENDGAALGVPDADASEDGPSLEDEVMGDSPEFDSPSESDPPPVENA